MKKLSRLFLALAALVLALSVGASIALARPVQAEDFAVKLEAALLMERCMDRIRQYKEELGLPLSPDDLHRTGMIGEPYTGITTTNGALEAKRTTAHPDMAALCVQLLEEAGVRPGDRVGAGFSGSFPAMNLAVLSACAAMGVEVVYIPSVGSSTYGANQPSLTFPDMVLRLEEEGLLPRQAAAWSLGGQSDCGLDMDPESVSLIRARLERSGVPLLYEEDFARNIARRMELYGPITCFIGVGGNLTTSGRGEGSLNLTWGVIEPCRVTELTEASGLLEQYCAWGLPVIHLLNIKRLVADYGLAYDPEDPLPPGESAIYTVTEYPRVFAALGAAAACGLLLSGRAAARRRETL